MKILSFLFLLTAVSFLSALSVFAAPASIEAASFVPSKVIFDGRELNLKRDPLVGIIREGENGVRHYMPLKAVLEQMGYIVYFDDSLNMVMVITPAASGPHVPSASSISVFASGGIRAAEYNNHVLAINGVTVDFNDDGIISVLRGTEADPTFFMPVRPVLEYLGYYVGWDNEQSTVIVASDSYFSSFGVLKPAEPPEITLQERQDGKPIDEEESATEPLPKPDMPPDEMTYYNLDESVTDAIDILMDGLQDPSSLIFHAIKYSGNTVYGYAVYLDFSSRNALGGYARRIAEVGVDGTLTVEGETRVEGAADNTVFYTAIRIAFQQAELYREF